MRTGLIRFVGVVCIWVLYVLILPSLTFYVAYPLARVFELDLARRDLHWLLCILSAAFANHRFLGWLRSTTVASPVADALNLIMTTFWKMLPFFAISVVFVVVYCGLGELIRHPQGQAKIVFEIFRVVLGCAFVGSPITLGHWLLTRQLSLGEGPVPVPGARTRATISTWLLRRR